MSPSIRTTAASLLPLLAAANGYKLESFSEKECKGDLQQTIDVTRDGCLFFDDKAASIQVSGGLEDSQWIFFNNYPCSSETQVGSWIGDVCFSQGETKLKAVSDYIVQGGKAKRNTIDGSLDKRDRAGIVETWQNGDCSGTPTNQMVFVSQNIPSTLNDVSSIRVRDVASSDIAYACDDTTCKVDNQVALLTNDECVNVEGKNVNSAIVIGVVEPFAAEVDARSERRSPFAEARQLQARDTDAITCSTANLVPFEDGLRVGDNWQGDNGLACCCHIPGGPSCRTSNDASGCISDDIRCPGDPSGTPPPFGSCPINCNQMRGYFYAIATECQNDDGMTGGVYHTATGDITLSHS